MEPGQPDSSKENSPESKPRVTDLPPYLERVPGRLLLEKMPGHYVAKLLIVDVSGRIWGTKVLCYQRIIQNMSGEDPVSSLSSDET